MAQYRPDAWVIVELGPPDARYHRVLGGWYGGFAGSNSWRLSSGITRIEKDGYEWKVHNESGSIYHCHHSCERTTSLTEGILMSYASDTEVAAKQVQLEDVLQLYNT